MLDRYPTLRRVLRLGAYLVLGFALTTVLALGILRATEPVQAVVYGLFYLRVGPSDATATAILAHFLAGGTVAIMVAPVLAAYHRTRLADPRPLAAGAGVLLALLVAFMVVALAGLAAFVTALVVLAIGLLGVPLLLAVHYDTDAEILAAFAGGIPVLVAFLFLAGFGIGWGWGYVVTAEEVPAGAEPETVVSMADAPEFQAALFEGDRCELDSDGLRECRLQLRGSAHEVEAVRFMADHGVRCPYHGAGASGKNSFVTEHDGTYYRVTCSPHGD